MRQHCYELEYVILASVPQPIMPFIRFVLYSLAEYHRCLNRKRHLKKLIWKICIWPCALASCQQFQPHLLLHCESVGMFLWALLRQLQALSLLYRIIPLPNSQRVASANLSLLSHLTYRLCKKNSREFSTEKSLWFWVLEEEFILTVATK